MTNNLIAYSKAKLYLAKEGCNVKPAAVEELRVLIKEFAEKIGKKATDIATEAKRKTIQLIGKKIYTDENPQNIALIFSN